MKRLANIYPSRFTAALRLAVMAVLCALATCFTFSLRAQDNSADTLACNNRFDWLAVKTNLLFDAVTAVNFELEVPIGSRFSIMAEDVCPWWHIGNRYCLQMWEMGVEARYWFTPWDSKGCEKLRGFFAGVYGMSAKYDLQWDRAINYQGEGWSAGISAGWSTPIGKKKRLNLELSLAVGYLSTDYRHYQPSDDYSILVRDQYREGTVTYFGPTKAKVSLVLPIRAKHKKEVNHE